MQTLYEKYRNIQDKKTISLFKLYYELLTEWNGKFNLTAITEKQDVEIKHFADSLAAIDMISGNIIDIGAGAGFPSIPLKIVNPSLKVTMADSSNKRINFLNEVIEKLDLKDIKAVHIRAEDIKEREYYDFAVARAVAPLCTLVEYLLPFVKVGGKMIAYKSDNIQDEIEQAKNAVKILGGAKIETEKIPLDSETVRSLVIIKKVKETPKKYPRGANKPRLSPLN